MAVPDAFQRALCLGPYALGPYWYHGTTPNHAQRILRDGFRVSRVSALGAGVYVAPRAVASVYGTALVAVTVDCPIVDWQDDACAAVRRRCGYPSSLQQAQALCQRAT
jgi:hypothetical protein